MASESAKLETQIMKTIKFSTVHKHPAQMVRTALTLALSVTLVACGGGGTTPNTSAVTPNVAASVTALLASTAFTSTSATLSTTANDPSSGLLCNPVTGLNCVVQITASSTTPGATVALASGQTVPFTANAQTLTLRVWASAANIPVRIRIENSTGSASPVDAQAMTTIANAWQTLVFDFSKPVSTLTTATAAAINNGNPTAFTTTSKTLASISPAAVDLTQVYNKVSVFFNEGKATTGETYFFSNLYFSAPTTSGQRPLSPEFLARKAVNYSPFRSATTVGDATKATDIANENITDEMVLQDLILLQNAGFGLIRIFNSDIQVGERVLRVIKANNLDIKVYLGMWMAGYNDVGNKDQMALGVALANSYPDIVMAVSVGNEALVNWSDHRMNAKVLASHLATVRSQIKQPVTTDDNWAYYAAADREVIDNIDFASVHSYAMVDTHYLPLALQWNWKQLEEKDLNQRATKMMDAAMLSTKNDYAAARTFLDLKGYTAMPIVIGETGWMNKDPGSGWYKFLAHPVNQKMYFDRLTTWANEGKSGAGPKNVFYFEAFDEQWKGSDDGWGLFNKNREARFAVQSLKTNGSTLSNCVVTAQNNCKWTWEVGSHTDADALYFKLPTLNAVETQPKYVIHSEAVNGWPDGLRADAYEANTFSLAYPATGDSASGDMGATLAASKYIKLSGFTPKAYGWGLLWQSSGAPTPVTANMSNFANGAIHFSVKTSYVGKLRVGISSNTELGDPVESNLLVSSGNYGYCTNTTAVWCDVSIPLSAFKAANPALDLRYILTRFSIADIFTETGNTAPTGMPDIALDNIYWAQ